MICCNDYFRYLYGWGGLRKDVLGPNPRKLYAPNKDDNGNDVEVATRHNYFEWVLHNDQSEDIRATHIYGSGAFFRSLQDPTKVYQGVIDLSDQTKVKWELKPSRKAYESAKQYDDLWSYKWYRLKYYRQIAGTCVVWTVNAILQGTNYCTVQQIADIAEENKGLKFEGEEPLAVSLGTLTSEINPNSFIGKLIKRLDIKEHRIG